MIYNTSVEHYGSGVTPLFNDIISLILNVCEITGIGLGFAEWVPACISIPPDTSADLLYAEAL